MTRGVKRPATAAAEDAQAAKRAATGVMKFKTGSDNNPPAVNTWVRVVPKGRLTAREASKANTPALVSAVTIEDGVGTAAIIYPNRLVLLNKFGGYPLKRELVPFDRIRPIKANDLELEKLEELLALAWRSACGSSVSKDVPAAEENDASEEKEALCGDDGHVADDSPASRSDEDEARPKPLAVSPEKVSKPQSLAKRWQQFTAIVGRALAGADHSRLSKTALAKLANLTMEEVEAGLAYLESKDKIFVCDDIVFLV